VRRWAWNLVGWTFVGIGLVGTVTPGLPTTVFMILALWCFKKGSPRFEHWLLNHRVFGPTLQVWEREKAITLRTKRIAVATMWAAIGLSSLVLARKPVVLSIVVAAGAFATWYILSRKTADPALYGKKDGATDTGLPVSLAGENP